MDILSDSELESLQGYFRDQCYLDVPLEELRNAHHALEILLAVSKHQDIKELMNNGIEKAPEIRDLVLDIFASSNKGWSGQAFSWEVLNEEILPNTLSRVKNEEFRKIRVWHTFCRSGEILYEAAMFIEKFIKEKAPKGVKMEDIEYIGTDISPSMLFRAAAGRYTEKLLQDLPMRFKNGYFTTEEHVCSLKKELKEKVRFIKQNLLDSLGDLGSFDIILHENPSNYLLEDSKTTIKNNIQSILNRDGYLLSSGDADANYFRKEGM